MVDENRNGDIIVARDPHVSVYPGLLQSLCATRAAFMQGYGRSPSKIVTNLLDLCKYD